MKINVGKYDRAIRITLGLIIIALGIVFKSFLGLFGIIPLATGILGYALFICHLELVLTKKLKSQNSSISVLNVDFLTNKAQL